MPITLNAHMARQLAFLRRSADDYDRGHLEEALRIAVVLRTLFHQTSRSTSLLTHLRAGSANIISTALDLPKAGTRGKLPRPLFYRGLVITRVSPGGVTAIPPLGGSETKVPIPFSKWWTQTVIIDKSIDISRKHIVLSAANQDGGAHFDENLSKEYEALVSEWIPKPIRIQLSQGRAVDVDNINAHFAILRQIAWEVLNSPDIISLAEPAPNSRDSDSGKS